MCLLKAIASMALASAVLDMVVMTAQPSSALGIALAMAPASTVPALATLASLAMTAL